MAKDSTRIGFVRRGFTHGGWVERYLARFATTLKERGHSSVLYTTDDWPDSEWDFEQIFRSSDSTAGSFASTLRRLNPRQNCDIVYSFEPIGHCHYYHAAAGVHRAWLDRRGVYESSLRRGIRALRGSNHQLLKLERGLLGRDSDTIVIANSEFARHEVLQYYGKPMDMTHIVYNGYKPPAKRGDPRTEIREQFQLNEPELMVLFSGDSWERQGLRFAIQACDLLLEERVKLFVAGKGSKRGMPSSPTVTYLGEIDDMAPYYEAADVYLLPTIYSSFANSCLEAASAGLPVVTTTSNGFAEIMLHGKHGDVVEDPSDSKDLALTLAKWLSRQKRELARDEIRKWARGFNIKETVAQAMDIIMPERAGDKSARARR